MKFYLRADNCQLFIRATHFCYSLRKTLSFFFIIRVNSTYFVKLVLKSLQLFMIVHHFLLALSNHMIFLYELLHHFTILAFKNLYYLLQFINFGTKQFFKNNFFKYLSNACSQQKHFHRRSGQFFSKKTKRCISQQIFLKSLQKTHLNSQYCQLC